MIGKNSGYLIFVVILLVFAGSGAIAKDVVNDHFVISSDLDPCFVDCVAKKAESCYEGMLGSYFAKGWGGGEDSLIIYYSETESASKALMSSASVNMDNVENGYSIDSRCVYAFRVYDDGSVVEDGVLFGGIARHFIEKNFRVELEWFKKELGQFISKDFVLTGDGIKLTRPIVGCCLELEKAVDSKNISKNMQNLFANSMTKYKRWELGHPFTQVFLSWLYNNQLFQSYIMNVQTHERGHGLATFTETTGLKYGEAKIEIPKFIGVYCDFQKKLKLIDQTSDFFEKEKLIEQAYDMVDDANSADMILAGLYYENADYDTSMRKLGKFLEDENAIGHWDALKMAANMCYRQKDYDTAIEYYQDLWNISGNYEYKYRIAYQIGNCYYYFRSRGYQAEQWYGKFLENKWNRADMTQCEEYAIKYIESKKQQ